MSWLGPASSGAHPRTKGARFCTGGHRHRLPLTTKGLPVARAAWQATGRPFAEGGRNADQQNARGAARREATFRSRGRGRLGGTRTRIKKALRAGRPAGHAAECGTGATPPKAGTAHGERGRSGAFAAATARARGAALGAAGFDWQRAFAVRVAAARPERAALAAALARGCAALRACRPLGNLDGQGGAAVLRNQLRNPRGLLADEHVQGELCFAGILP